MKKALSLVLAALCLSAVVSCDSKKESDLLTYRYDYDLSEYITLPDYKGLEAEGYRINITDEDIERQILSTRSYYSKVVDVERGAEFGDTVYINYVGSMDGDVLPEASEDDAEVVVGAGSLPEDFENSLMGAKKGEHLSFDITFPDPYIQYPDFSGKYVHFEVDVTDVCEQILPDYTDDFVRAYLGYESTEEYEKDIVRLLEEHYTDIYYENIDKQIWPTIIENTVVKKYPSSELRTIYDDMVSSVEAYAASYGVNFADYLNAIYHMSEDEFYASIQTQAEEYVKDEMVKYAIARAEGITLSDDEYAKGAKEYAIGIYELDSVEQFEEMFDKENIRQTLMYEKVHEKVVDYASITYIESPVK